MRRIERAVTLLPQPDSPTMPRCAGEQVERGTVHRAHHAFIRKEVRVQIADREDGSAIRIRRVAQPIAQEIERQDNDDHRHRGEQQPRREAK